jgi:putative tricarboxylic transport membrane protein
VLGAILGPQAETAFMTSMISYGNDWTVFFTRPISGTVVALSILALLFPLARHLLQQRKLATGLRTLEHERQAGS